MGRNRRILSILLGIGLLLSASGARPEDFGQWRSLTVEEEKSRTAGIPAESVDPSLIEADFNGDGRMDKALIAVRETDRVRDLIVDLGSRLEVLVRSEEGGEGMSPQSGIRLAKPGRWETICGNAFRDLQAGMCESENYPKFVHLKHPGIICLFDGETLLYFWDEKEKTFSAVSLAN